MLLTISLQELKETFADVANVAVAAYRKEANPADDAISQREAYKQFSRVRVERWLAEGMINAQRLSSSKNSKKTFSRSELMQLDAAERLRPIMCRQQANHPTQFAFGK